MKKNLKAVLKKELKLLKEASEILKRSYEICSKIGCKTSYPIEELDHFEALTARFARLSDIIIQKILRLIDELDLESTGSTVRDRINRAEKKGLVQDADIFIKIRLLRNDIAHEYLESAIHGLFTKVMDWTPDLIDSVERIKQYVERYD